MNPYDKAHELARALTDSEELTALLEAKRLVEQDPNDKLLMESFRQKQMEMSTYQMQGTEPSKELTEEWTKLVTEVSGKPNLAQYLEAEGRVGQLMQDINRILAAPFEELNDSDQG
ncbi:Cell fate regulator YlbF, YheA/YmcA/DUF963 family (controls sporulation, competence, biofilm development) [Marininema mesophilum]|uniref:Cell fate regulator YlbF, YheA/YmcA/DUF963 family (Controls sporulation, competence, biofilm development) n=1 Tax=Marininema mesophilum TaxID=1048340 RepID=A0A1H2XYV6_9BACL|nr:YlbF family regulator [Marininema mesophilum]SDW97624.1 Cell fate regulator YlbF, YheA/YmcA/DUF963 family (controls sporulation, competence, biofilm development) [Marininema mesophilum]